MKIGCKLLCVFLICAFILPHTTYETSAAVTRAGRTAPARISVESEPVAYRGLGVTAMGERPVVSLPSNRQLENEINQRINEIYDIEISTVRRPAARTLVFSHSIRRSGDVVTILIEVSSAANRPAQSAFGVTVDLGAEKIISLTDVEGLGINALQICNQAVNDAISANPLFSNANFNEVDDTRCFYLDDNAVVLLFNEGEIAPAHLGVQRVRVEMDSILSVTIERDRIDIREDFYNLKLIPLRDVVQELGFDLSWNAATREIRVSHGQFETVITINRNSFFRVRGAVRSLEAAPFQNEYGITFVPLSFFDQILDVSYSEDENGNIVFSIYRPEAGQTDQAHDIL